jgi:hypothetical protein
MIKWMTRLIVKIITTLKPSRTTEVVQPTSPRSPLYYSFIWSSQPGPASPRALPSKPTVKHVEDSYQTPWILRIKDVRGPRMDASSDASRYEPLFDESRLRGFLAIKDVRGPRMVAPSDASMYEEFLKRLEEAYGDGRITEHAYRRLKDEYERKIKRV